MKENYVCTKAKERVIVFRKALVLRSLNTFNSWGVLILSLNQGHKYMYLTQLIFFFVYILSNHVSKQSSSNDKRQK